MSLIIIFALLVYGICNIIVFANGPFHIFKKMHEYLKANHPMLDEVTTCMICLPTWVAMFISTVNLALFPAYAITPMNMLIADKVMWPVIIFFDGLIGSGVNWLIHTVQELAERTNANED